MSISFNHPWRKMLVFFACFLAENLISAVAQIPATPNSVAEIKMIRSIDPTSLRLSERDRLSGGLSQGVLFRMATDSQGRVLVTDPHLSLIQVLDIEGGTHFQLKGDHVQRMVFPTYIAVDGDDDIYVSEPILGSVLEFFPDGRFARAIGGNELSLPFGLAVDKTGQRLFVVDHEKAAIAVYSLEGKFLKRIGGFGSGAGELNHPTEIVFVNGVLYVLDTGNARFEAFASEGEFKAVLPFGDSRLPLAFAADASGKLYCVDGLSLGMLVLDAAGNLLTEFGARRPFGQPSSTERGATYTSLIERKDGAILALRPNLVVDVLKLEFRNAAESPTTNSPPKPDQQ